MSLNSVESGKNAPSDIYVIIENPKDTPNIKYEVDKDSGCVFVDRFAPMPMVFPAHYGYVNQTLGGDGDPIDVFVVSDIPVIPGCVIRARPVAVLRTEDESGDDPKVVCVPHQKLDKRYDNIKDVEDLCPQLKGRLEQFYKHYKNLEPNKWVKVNGWGNCEDAKQVIIDGINNYK